LERNVEEEEDEDERARNPQFVLIRLRSVKNVL
jgi:hypothetical protein